MIAIIIPFYKLTYFDQTLKSLAAQTDKRFVVYIGDDCSPEDPTPIINNYKSDLEIFYYRFKNNLGGVDLVEQWHRSIALSNDEEWLMVLGDDDFLGENVIEEFYNYIEKNKDITVDLVRFKLQIVNHLGVIQENEFRYDTIEDSEKLLSRMFSKEETITASEFIFSRNVFKLNNGFIRYPLAWFSDYATWLQYGKKSNIHNIKTTSVYWRLSNINISSQLKSVKLINLKVSSLFHFMLYVHNNFNVDSVKKNNYIFEHLNYLFYEIKLFDIYRILLPKSYRFNLNFLYIISRYIFYRTRKSVLKKMNI